jgi:two-component sensor histidine kinase
MGANLLVYILGASILLQLAAAVTALALMRRSGFHLPWILVSVAITLMAIRRITTFVGLLQRDVFPDSALGPELIALVISVFMLAGLLLFRPAFAALSRARERELSDKDLLIRESHHHVKNDLQMLQSLIRLQLNTVKDSSGRSLLQDLMLRVRAFSVLHDHIYRTVGGQLSFRSYIGNLAQAISDNFPDESVRFRVDLTESPVDRRELLYAGLIVNEALTNAYKYAFSEEVAEPTITISNREEGDRVVVEISDNGAGISEEYHSENSSSYGLSLIRGIGRYPGWTLDIFSHGRQVVRSGDFEWPGRGAGKEGAGEGTRIVFSFPLAAKARQERSRGERREISKVS